MTHLRDKSVGEPAIRIFYEQLLRTVGTLYHKYNQMKIYQVTHPTEMELKIQYEIITINGRQIHIYRYGNVYVKYTQYIHNRLMTRYNGDIRCLKFAMFEMGFNYYILEGHSFQWSVPPKAINTLENILSTQTELFASPINVVLPHYYSLFHIDRLFGSLGNFFSADVSGIHEGTYEVNPPFIERVFIESSKIITGLLAVGGDLLFIYIMPKWCDSDGYKHLVGSGYLLDEIVLPEKNHFYHYSSKHQLVEANFETHVLIVGTPTAKHRWTTLVRQQFIDNFTHY
jgi:hypothetical protein